MDDHKVIELYSIKTYKEKQYIEQLIRKEFDIFDECFLGDYAEKFAHNHDDFMMAVFTYAFARGFIKGKEAK